MLPKALPGWDAMGCTEALKIVYYYRIVFRGEKDHSTSGENG
jgi:hypothetical protein